MDEATIEQPGVRAGEPNRMLTGGMLVTGHGIKHLFNAGFFVILPELQIGLRLSNSAIGTLSTIRSAGSGLANMPAGYISDRFSDRWAVVLSTAIAAVGIFHFLMGTVSVYWLLVLTATLGSMAISFWHPPAIAALSQMFANRRGFAIALHGMGGSIGEAVGPITVGALLEVFLWRTVLQGSAVPGLAMAAFSLVVMWGFRGTTGSPGSFRKYVAAVLRLLRSRALVTILITTGGFVSAQTIVITFLPIYLRVELGYSALAMSAFLSAAQAVGIVSQPVMGYLSDRFSRKAVILPAILSLGSAIFAIPFAESTLALLLVVAVMGAFSFPLMSIFLAAALDVAEGDVPATTVSLVFGAAVVLSAVAPAIAGVLADAAGVKAVFGLASGIAFVTGGFTAVRSLSD